MRSEVRNVTPSNGLAWSAMLDNAYPLERPGGGLFFAAAFSAGERAPSETIERYAFLRVRRARTRVLRARKALIFH